MLAVGIDIGGTKCAVNIGRICSGKPEVLYKCNIIETKKYKAYDMLEKLAEDVQECIGKFEGKEAIAGVGISCGGPLNSKAGIIMSPPNLPGWDRVHIVDYISSKTGLKAWLCNDANACALAEWKYGAGMGTSNMIFLTFGTGLGAGIIIDGHLYTGASDMAGEVGHIRLSEYGPVGYGKMGSFEGFCSGGGIAQLAGAKVREQIQQGIRPELLDGIKDISEITAAIVGNAAKQGDKTALEILKLVGIQLGRGLSAIIDTLNPECIVIGSIFNRCYEEIWPYAEEVIKTETLPAAYNACRVCKSKLEDQVGDIAGLVIADYYK